MARGEPIAATEHVARQVLQEVERPRGRRLVVRIADDAQRQLEAEPALLGIVGHLTEQNGDPVRDEVKVRHRRSAQVDRDAVQRIVAAEHRGQHRAVVLGLGVLVDRLERGVDGVPAGRLVVVIVVATRRRGVGSGARAHRRACRRAAGSPRAPPRAPATARSRHAATRSRARRPTSRAARRARRSAPRPPALRVERLEQRALRGAVVEPAPREIGPARRARRRASSPATSSVRDASACARTSASCVRAAPRRGSRSSARNSASQPRTSLIVPSSLRPASSSSISRAASRTSRALWRRPISR